MGLKSRLWERVGAYGYVAGGGASVKAAEFAAAAPRPRHGHFLAGRKRNRRSAAVAAAEKNEARPERPDTKDREYAYSEYYRVKGWAF